MPQAATKTRPSARPAQFDAANQERRVLIAKIHVAKKEMQLLDDDYRQMLVDTTGRASSADCTVAELRAMIEAMKAKGFRPKKAGSLSGRPSHANRGRPAKESSSGRSTHANRTRPADHPFAAKARALWISLYHLNAIDNPSEAALEAFARRQMGCERMQWANQAQCYKLIEALKAIANRHGWNQRTDFIGGIKRKVPADAALRTLKVRLVEAIAHKLGEKRVVPVEMPLGQIAWTLAGMERDGPVALWELGDLDLLAKALGEKLRAATGGQSGGLDQREQGR